MIRTNDTAAAIATLRTAGLLRSSRPVGSDHPFTATVIGSDARTSTRGTYPRTVTRAMTTDGLVLHVGSATPERLKAGASARLKTIGTVLRERPDGTRVAVGRMVACAR